MRALSHRICPFICIVVRLEEVIDFPIRLKFRAIFCVSRIGGAERPLIYQIIYGSTDFSERELRWLVLLYDIYHVNKDVVGPRKPWMLCIIQRTVVSRPAFRIRKLRESRSEIIQGLSRPQVTKGTRIRTVTGFCTTRLQREWQIYLIEIRNIITDI